MNALPDRILKTVSHFPTSALALPDGRRAITTGMDGTLRLWDLESREELRRFTGHRSIVWSAALLPDGIGVLSSSADETCRLWNLNNGFEIGRVAPPGKLVLSVLALWDSQRVISRGASKIFALWDLNTGLEIRRFVGHTDQVTSIALSPDQRQVLSGSRDCTLRLWDVETGTELHRYTGHTRDVTSVAMLSDGRALSGSRDLTLRLWNLETGKQIRRFEGHTQEIGAVALLSDGKRAVSAANDGSLRLWNLVNGAQIQTFQGHAREIHSISVLPRERRLLTASADETLRQWEIDFTREPTGESLTYTTVRVALLGDSNVGKTALGWRIARGNFKEQISSHGQQYFWVVDELSLLRDDGTQCEAILWDMAGQADYRLVHALFLEQVDIGLLLFDPANRERPLGGVEYWLRNLRSATSEQPNDQSSFSQQPAVPILLVAARIDRGTPSLTANDLDEFCRRNGIAHYVATSATANIGIEILLARIRANVPWERLTPTTTTKTFKFVKDHIFVLKSLLEQDSVLLSPSLLRAQLLEKDKNRRFTDAEMMAAVSHLANHGYVAKLKLANGADTILLSPDLLANLASSIILEARRHDRGLGLIDETQLLAGRYYFPELATVDIAERAALLDATVGLFLRRNLCFRELVADRTMLVFPSLINQKTPLSVGAALVEDVSYRVTGATENVYAALVVQLGYTNLFRRDDHWQNQAQYELAPGELCSFRQSGEGDGQQDFVLSYSAAVDFDTRSLFQGAFERFLKRRQVQILRFPSVRCRKGHHQKLANVRDAVDKDRLKFFCDECGEVIVTPKADRIGSVGELYAEVLHTAENIVDRRTDYEVALAWLKAYRRDRGSESERPSCFISYSWGYLEHEQWIGRLAEYLQSADVVVVYDRWHNTPGTSIARFLEGISTSDFVCAVGTPEYAAKDHADDSDPVAQAELRLIKTKLRKRDEIRNTVIPNSA